MPRRSRHHHEPARSPGKTPRGVWIALAVLAVVSAALAAFALL
jgi:hypothetical protein